MCLRTSIRLENTETRWTACTWLATMASLRTSIRLENTETHRGRLEPLWAVRALKNLDSFREYWNKLDQLHMSWFSCCLRTSIRLENTETLPNLRFTKPLVRLKNLDSFREYWNQGYPGNQLFTPRLRTSIRLENTETLRLCRANTQLARCCLRTSIRLENTETSFTRSCRWDLDSLRTSIRLENTETWSLQPPNTARGQA